MKLVCQEELDSLLDLCSAESLVWEEMKVLDERLFKLEESLKKVKEEEESYNVNAKRFEVSKEFEPDEKKKKKVFQKKKENQEGKDEEKDIDKRGQDLRKDFFADGQQPSHNLEAFVRLIKKLVERRAEKMEEEKSVSDEMVRWGNNSGVFKI